MESNNYAKLIKCTKQTAIIVGYDCDTRGIGYVNLDKKNQKTEIPWPYIKADMRNFYEITTKTKDAEKQNAVIMGRLTWESLPNDKKPLKNRINIIVSSNIHCYSELAEYYVNSLYIVNNINEALDLCNINDRIENVFYIGGEQIYKYILDSSNNILPDRIYVTENFTSRISDLKFNRFMPEISEYYEIIKTSTAIDPVSSLNFIIYEKSQKSQEYRYLDLMQKILEEGKEKDDRTNTGVLSLIGQQLRFDLTRKISDNDQNYEIILPLITTKKMFTKGIIEELLMFIRGDVDTTKLSDKGIKIWEGNTSREFLDKNNMSHIEEGSLGKGYSFQWRAWGAQYKSKYTDHKKEPNAVDQLSEIVRMIKEDPYSRRIIMSAWNVSDLKEMALPPCHMDYHFIVESTKSAVNENKRYLNCVMHQRSGDMFLGVPFNICSTALLTILIASVCDLIPGEIIINIDDAHIYKNAIVQTKIQLERKPFKFPKFNLKKKITSIEDMENLVLDDFEIIDYKCHPAIKANMAI